MSGGGWRTTIMQRNKKESMPMTDGRKDVSAQDARGGVETGTVRWVLRISLALAVAAGLVIYFTFFDL